MLTQILVRSGKAPHASVRAEAAIARRGLGTFASNAGNALFTNAVFRALNTPGATVVSDSLTTERTGMTSRHVHRINEEFDALVLPMANSFRPSFSDALNRLSSVVERLEIPVVVAGVGAQFSLYADESQPAVDAAAKRFVSAVLDRSASIGVRGERTRDYLIRLGFPESSVDVIGCPSMFDSSRTFRVERRVSAITADSPIAISVDHRVDGVSETLTSNAVRYPNLTFVSQNFEEARLLLWGTPIEQYPDDLPGTREHAMYRDGRIRFFIDPARWREFLATQHFAFGTRLHGTMAALQSGIPAVLLAHDSRTLELAEYHAIPHRHYRGGDVDPAELFETADLDALNARQPETFDRYVRFLERNGLDHIHRPGKSNPDYDDLLRPERFPRGCDR